MLSVDIIIPIINVGFLLALNIIKENIVENTIVSMDT